MIFKSTISVLNLLNSFYTRYNLYVLMDNKYHIVHLCNFKLRKSVVNLGLIGFKAYQFLGMIE